MPILVFDDFNRANNPTGLGTATTGQVWTVETGNVGNWQISSNSALWTWDSGDPNGRATVDSGFTSGIVKVTQVDWSGPQNFGVGEGVIFRWVDINYYWRLVYYNFAGPTNVLRLQRIYAGSITSVLDVDIVPFLAVGDSISCAYCGSNFEVFWNAASQGTYDDTGNPQNYGTKCGLYGDPGTYFTTLNKTFNDFTVTTNGTCTPTYNCTGGACVDPGDGTGTYATLAACLSGCTVAASYNCVGGQCIDPGDGTGTYSTLQACVDSGCGGGTVVVETMKFDAGTGSGYYYVAPIVDSGDELRSKTVKAVRATGKFTNAASEIYGYDVSDVVSTSDLEQGLNSTTGQLPITDTSGVAQTPREQVNVPNAVLHTVRILGDDTGQTERDRIDEIVTEQSDIGVRR